jgi:short-subunit dehydrogenase
VGALAKDVLVLPIDLLRTDDMPAKVDIVLAHFKGLDVLINNAGISQRSLCIDTELSTYKTLIDVDVFGQIALTKAVLPLMLKQGSGHIAVTSSVAGKVGVKLRTGYCAAKHAVMGFFDALRAEVAEHNIKVSTITPGFIKTEVSINAMTSDGSKFGVEDDDIKNGMDVDKCAAIIVEKMNKGVKEIVVGRGLSVFVLILKRYFPNLVFTLMANKKI